MSSTVFCFLPSHQEHHYHSSLQCYLFIFVLHQLSMDVVCRLLDLTVGTQRVENNEARMKCNEGRLNNFVLPLFWPSYTVSWRTSGCK